MKNPNTKIYAQNGNHGLDIYLDISGIPHYLTTRRPNGVLYKWLKNGKTLGELSRLRPHSSPTGQKKYHYVQHLIKLVNDYCKFELAA